MQDNNFTITASVRRIHYRGSKNEKKKKKKTVYLTSDHIARSHNLSNSLEVISMLER